MADYYWNGSFESGSSVCSRLGISFDKSNVACYAALTGNISGPDTSAPPEKRKRGTIWAVEIAGKLAETFSIADEYRPVFTKIVTEKLRSTFAAKGYAISSRPRVDDLLDLLD